MLSAHVGSTVCMAGRLAPGSGGTLEMDTSDKGKVVVRGAAAAQTKVVQQLYAH